MFGAIGIDGPIWKIMPGIAGPLLGHLAKWVEATRDRVHNVTNIELDTYKPALDSSIETTRIRAAARLSSRRR